MYAYRLLFVIALVGCAGRDDPDDSQSPVDPVEEPSCEPVAGLLLNEVSSSTIDGGLLDATGRPVDWVELYNGTPDPIDLTGWSLSDSDDPEWGFPAGTLDPGGLLLVRASGAGRRTPVAAWDTRIAAGDDWRYLPVTEAPDSRWAQPGFDDDSWAVGPSGFGRGDEDDGTEVVSDTVYVRTDFEVTAAEQADLVALVLHVDYDDGFVAYLDGVEVARAGMSLVSGRAPAWDEPSDIDNEAQTHLGEAPQAFDIGPALPLAEGTHTLAIEVHNVSASGDGDLTLIPWLSLGFATERSVRTADELDFAVIDLDASFKLSARGEELNLFDPAGCRADQLEPVSTWGNESYGRQPDGDANLGYFLEPTPGASNTTEMRPGFAALPTFDPPAGYASAGDQVAVSGSPDATVHVALGGEEPAESDDSGPVTIPADADALVVRARAEEPDLWPSRIATATYLVDAPADLPILSLVTDPQNLWDEETGIYVFGPVYEEEWPYEGANFWQDWDRPVHVEEWEPDGTPGFSVDGRVEIQGQRSRANAQKGLWVDMDSAGGGGSIEHELFPGLGITSFDQLELRASGNDWLGCATWGCSQGAHLRDALTARLIAGEDLDIKAYRPANVYLNGEYWGVYEMRERLGDSYIEAHHGQTDIDLLELEGIPIEGDGVRYQQDLEYLRSHDLTDPAVYEHVKTLIDVDQFATFLALEVFVDNKDFPCNNIKYWRPRTADGRWRWLLYDTDLGLGGQYALPSDDTLAKMLQADGPKWPNPPWSTELTRLLFGSPEFKEAWINRYADYLNTIFATQTARDALYELADGLAPAIDDQYDRWGTWTDGTTTHTLADDTWEEQVEWLEDWLDVRPDFAREHVVANFGLEGTWTLDLVSDPPGAGTFLLHVVEVEAPWSGTYFRGVPVTITAIPTGSRQFVGWSDSSLPQVDTITVDPDEALTLTARFE